MRALLTLPVCSVCTCCLCCGLSRISHVAALVRCFGVRRLSGRSAGATVSRCWLGEPRCAGLACRALNKALTAEDKSPQCLGLPAKAKELLELRAQLWGELGVEHWQRHELARIKHYFPPGYPVL